MLGFLKKQWWKWTSIVLLSFAFLSGLLIPLGSGIISISPENISVNNIIELQISAYNTQFVTGDTSLKFFLKSDKTVLCGSVTNINNATEATVTFPALDNEQINHKKTYFTLIAQNGKNGTFLLRKALLVQPNKQEIANVSEEKFNCNTEIKPILAKGLTFPYREILYETIRNLFFHVPMWFSMILLLLFAFIANIKYLGSNNSLYDTIAASFASVGLFFGTLGILTGMQWANFTWGAPWINDPKLNGAAVGMLIYLAYFVLRGSLENEQTRARVSAVYGIFAFVIFIVFIFVLPRLSDSLHPGSGGNPGFNTYDLDNTMRPVFYSAVLGFSGLGYWMASILVRYHLIQQQNDLV
jgi:heme exporter protein C